MIKTTCCTKGQQNEKERKRKGRGTKKQNIALFKRKKKRKRKDNFDGCTGRKTKIYHNKIIHVHIVFYRNYLHHHHHQYVIKYYLHDWDNAVVDLLVDYLDQQL